jgi:hypothetical protein
MYMTRGCSRAWLFGADSITAPYGRVRCCSSSTEPELLRGRHGLLRAKQVDLAGGRHGHGTARPAKHRSGGLAVAVAMQMPARMLGVVNPGDEVSCP